jgi:hypothetical protein
MLIKVHDRLALIYLVITIEKVLIVVSIVD